MRMDATCCASRSLVGVGAGDDSGPATKTAVCISCGGVGAGELSARGGWSGESSVSCALMRAASASDNTGVGDGCGLVLSSKATLKKKKIGSLGNLSGIARKFESLKSDWLVCG